MLVGATLLLYGARGDQKPHAFRVVSDEAWSQPTKIVWLDGSEPLSLGVPANLYVRSPDRRTVVFGSQFDDRLRYVDLVSKRLKVGSRTTAYPYEESCAANPRLWAEPHRIIATGWCGDAHRTGASTLAIVDPVAGKATMKTIGSGDVIATRDAAVFLVPPPPIRLPSSPPLEEQLGPSTLMRVAGDGSVAAIKLRIRSGMRDSRTFIRWPGFAVRGDRAVVVSEDEGSAEIDLRTLRVKYHGVSFPAPSRRSLDPPLPHQGTLNPARVLSRKARWIDDRRIAVTGYDVWTANHFNQCGEAGPWILDTQTWTANRVSPTAKVVAKQRPYITQCLQ